MNIDDEAMQEVFNLCLLAEEDFIDEIKRSARDKDDRRTNKEVYLRGGFDALYNLITSLGYEEKYNEWRNTPEEEE